MGNFSTDTLVLGRSKGILFRSGFPVRREKRDWNLEMRVSAQMPVRISTSKAGVSVSV